MTGEEKQEYSSQAFSSTDALKRRIIDYLFTACTKACDQEKSVADYTYETGFVRAVRLSKSMLWKYTPPEIRTQITELYKELEDGIMKIESSSLSDENKLMSKQKVGDDVSMQVLEFLVVVLQYSPMSVEYKEMEVFGDFKELIETIRSKDKVKLFTGELANE